MKVVPFWLEAVLEGLVDESSNKQPGREDATVVPVFSARLNTPQARLHQPTTRILVDLYLNVSAGVCKSAATDFDFWTHHLDPAKSEYIIALVALRYSDALDASH
jgi:hypothetical protein